MKKLKNYPFPWFKGFLFQDAWIVRSVWYGFSSEGMLEFISLDGSKNFCKKMCTFSAGLKSGTVNKKISVTRIMNDNQILMSLDLLSKGMKANQGLDSQGLSFCSLTKSPAFHSKLNSKTSLTMPKNISFLDSY